MGFNVVYQQFRDICTTVVVRSAVTGPDSSLVLTCQHTEVPCRRSTWYLTQSLETDI